MTKNAKVKPVVWILRITN